MLGLGLVLGLELGLGLGLGLKLDSGLGLELGFGPIRLRRRGDRKKYFELIQILLLFHEQRRD